mmetsp:Transcript_34933/g.84520  ORF Transcript_34933/g.84520 Transcript_34933/m.84520 type:complete len:427 (-) Transcript_34933:116-1396(-)
MDKNHRSSGPLLAVCRRRFVSSSSPSSSSSSSPSRSAASAPSTMNVKQLRRRQRSCYRRFKSSSTSPSTPPATAASLSPPQSVATSTRRSLWQRYTDLLMERPLLVKASTASLIFFVSDSATQYIMMEQQQKQQQQQLDGGGGLVEVEPFHWGRALSGATFGVVATGWLHYWWGFLEAAVQKRLPVANYRLANTLVKVVVDQAIGAPIYIFTYYCITHFGKEYMSLISSQSSSLAASAASNTKTETSAFDDDDDDVTATANTNTNSGVLATNVDDDTDSSHASSARSPASAAAYQLWTETVDRAIEMLPPTMIRHWSVWPFVHTINFYYFSLHHRVLVQNLVLVGWSGYLSHLNNGGLKKQLRLELEQEEEQRLLQEVDLSHLPHGQIMTPEEEVESVAEEKEVIKKVVQVRRRQSQLKLLDKKEK